MQLSRLVDNLALMDLPDGNAALQLQQIGIADRASVGISRPIWAIQKIGDLWPARALQPPVFTGLTDVVDAGVDAGTGHLSTQLALHSSALVRKTGYCPTCRLYGQVESHPLENSEH